MMRESLIIIGNGMAGARLAEELVKREPGRFAITIVGDEPGFAYNRVLLSAVLAGDADAADLELKPAGWWQATGVEVVWGAVSHVDAGSRTVHLGDGRAFPFAKLVFATGSRAVMLPIPGMDLPGVESFRTAEDTAKLAAFADTETAASIVVIGGGLLGVEAAYGLARRGARVVLVHLMGRLMERQLNGAAAAMVKASLERRGIMVMLEARTIAITGDGRANGITLADGRTIAADAVVVAAGVQPNADLARQTGLHVARGIVVNEFLETSAPGIYAIGECAEAAGHLIGLVEPAYAQAAVLARRLTGDPKARYEPDIGAASLKVSGLPVFSAGDFLGGSGTSSVLLRDPDLGIYKRLVIRDGVLTGAVLVGDTADAGYYLDLMRRKAPIEAFRANLAFGRAYCEAGDASTGRRAA